MVADELVDGEESWLLSALMSWIALKGVRAWYALGGFLMVIDGCNAKIVVADKIMVNGQVLINAQILIKNLVNTGGELINNHQY